MEGDTPQDGVTWEGGHRVLGMGWGHGDMGEGTQEDTQGWGCGWRGHGDGQG